ncbi:MAG: sugar transferase [Flavisolibacter sp.]|jgi:lipopolysaccharide/colanic/teichoic acid biosynthesis glycosyltransferase|nr:sugar transferase [Flavisolibacter sp.]
MELEPPLPNTSTGSVLESVSSSHVNLSIASQVHDATRYNIHYAAVIPLEKLHNAFLKRCTDVFLSIILILLIFPWFLPLVALLIKAESGGPIFFKQKRIKKLNQLFTCLKFRTMFVNNEADTHPATPFDPRITRVGRFLRNTHLDELPQLWNVLVGDMSLIGPRPHMISDHQKFEPLIDKYHIRQLVKPGITGLAQVLGYTGPVTDINVMKGRIVQDVFYVCHWHPGLDLKIILKTISKMLFIKQRREK